ncbi:unnamed protein product [Calicophoron daubneyi]|uniref:Tetraspanning orphan receptor n=1 Tax=Calicophoron daubneyi TaxID=300641 RepID=A0AAV2TGG3_CALDB
MVRVPTARDRHFRCCFCLHVRTGTILLGVAQIILHVICISVLILLALKPDILPPTGVSFGKDHNYAVISADQPGARSNVLSIILHLVPGVSDLQDSIALPPPRQLKKDDTDTGGHVPTTDVVPIKGDKVSGNHSDLSMDDLSRHLRFEAHVISRRRRHLSPYFALCLSTFSLAFCCFLVHGAVSRQPTHLLPFFFLQVFDFIISLLTVVGYMSSTSDIRLWLHTKNGSMYVNSTSLTFLLLSISCMVLAFKAYCLGMVWDCYKYLMLTSHGGREDDWSSDRYGFLPTIWGLLGTGRRSMVHRNGVRPGRVAGQAETERGGAPRPPPATYDQTNDLPNYEEALKIPANAYAPPPYFCPADLKKSATEEGPAVTTNTSTTGATNSNGNAPSPC